MNRSNGASRAERHGNRSGIVGELRNPACRVAAELRSGARFYSELATQVIDDHRNDVEGYISSTRATWGGGRLAGRLVLELPARWMPVVCIIVGPALGGAQQGLWRK